MSILVDRATRAIVQGITGRTGSNVAARMRDCGTPIVGGVTPGRGGQRVTGLPVFDDCYRAVADAGANASFVSVPPPFVLDACLEAIDAGLSTIVVYCEGVAVEDSLKIARAARDKGVRLLGPNSAGCVSPGMANLSDLHDDNLDPGRVGIVSKSGTLTYEVIDGLRQLELGESTVVCLGGDPVTGMDHADALRLFEADADTDVVVLIGEIGGRSELVAAEVAAGMSKPVVAFIAGRAAPPGKRMGHAGALLGAADENAPGKMAMLAAAGCTVVERLTDVADAAAKVLRASGRAPHPT